jgi:hypothetical protein
MSAGTVISGGFPGRVAQEVTPNAKCRGCLHYDGQAGRIGACTIGLRPWLCGDGEAQDVGYAPIGKGAGTYLHDLVNDVPQAHEVDGQVVGGLYGSGSTRPVHVQHVSLGEEHAHFVKSMVAEHVRVQKSQCRFCLNTGSHGTQPANVLPQVCSCQPLAARDVAKALVGKLDNRQRVSMSIDDLTKFVRAVAANGFALPTEQVVKGLKWHENRMGAETGTTHGSYNIERDHDAGPGRYSAHYHPYEAGRAVHPAGPFGHEHTIEPNGAHDVGLHHSTHTFEGAKKAAGHHDTRTRIAMKQRGAKVSKAEELHGGHLQKKG